MSSEETGTKMASNTAGTQVEPRPADERAAKLAERARRHEAHVAALAERREARERRRERRRHTRGRRWALTVVLAAALGGGAYAWTTREDDTGPREATVALVEDDQGSGGRALLVTQGSLGLRGLLEAAEGLVGADAVTRDDAGAWQIGVPVIVGPSGRLQITNSEVRLRSDSEVTVSLQARGGELHVDESTITSWDPEGRAPDEELEDGRAYLLAVAGGHMTVVDSDIENLGDAEGRTSGLTWEGERTGGALTDSRVTDGKTGVRIDGVTGLTVRDTVVRAALGDGIQVLGTTDVVIDGGTVQGSKGSGLMIGREAEAVRVHDVEITDSTGPGLVITDASFDLEVTGSRIGRNGGAGVIVDLSREVRLEDNEVWGNDTGLAIQSSSAGVVVHDNRISGNGSAGVSLASTGAVVSVTGNRIDHNAAGVLVAEGDAVVESNAISANDTGVRVLDHTPHLVVEDNVIADNFGEGVTLVATEGIEMSGNTVADNVLVAFSVLTADASRPLWETNTVSPGRRGYERVLLPTELEPRERIAPPLQRTPVTDYFFRASEPPGAG
jgi:hypothetical protein